MQRIKKQSILCIFLFLFLFPLIPSTDAATTELNTFQDNPIEYWTISDTGTNSLVYHQNNTIDFGESGTYEDSLALYAVSGVVVSGSISSGDYSSTWADDSTYWSGLTTLYGGTYKAEFYVKINVTDYISTLSQIDITCNGRITNLIGVTFKQFSVYNNHSSSWEQIGSDLSTSDSTESKSITSNPEYYTNLQSGCYYILIRAYYWKSVSAGYIHFDYCKVDISYNANYPNYNVTIPIENMNDITVKTMLSYSGTINTDTNFSIIFETLYGDITNINFTIDSNNFSDGAVYRLEYNFKKAINVFRLTITDSNQVVIYRNQQIQIISKDITALRIECYNIPNNGKVIMYYLSGNLQYSIKPEWNTYEITASNYDTYSSWHYELTTSGAITTTSDIIANVSFSNFQYIRSYMNMLYTWSGTIDDNIEISGTYVIIEIGNIEIAFYIRTYADVAAPRGSYGWFEFVENGSPIYSLDGDFSDEASSDTYTYVNNFKIWRTLNDHIGLGFASDSEMFRDSDDSRRTKEDFTYIYSQNKVTDFSGNITIEYIYDVANSAGSYYSIQIDFAEMEYDFTSDFGIAEPHFSSTWFDLFGGLFGKGLQNIWQGITAIWDNTENPLTDLFDWLGDMGNQIYTSLSPSFDLVFNGLDTLGSAIGGAASDIIDQIIATFNDIGSNIGDWLADAVSGIVDAVVSVASAIADFIVWFVNGIGSLMGITDLAGSFGTLVSNFVDALAGWIGGFTTIVTMLAGGISWAFTIVGTYAPLALYILTIVFVLSILAALVSMDFDYMTEVLSFWVRVASAFGNICYQIANAVIQFIGGIIP